MAHLAGGEVEVHGDGVGGVHEDVRHAHQVLDGLHLQAEQVPVEGLPADGLQKGVLSGAGAVGLRVLLPSSEACGSNLSSIYWPLRPMTPEQPGR